MPIPSSVTTPLPTPRRGGHAVVPRSRLLSTMPRPAKSSRPPRLARGHAPCRARRRQALPSLPGDRVGAPVRRRARTVRARGAAVECVHSYSLVHDDLPAMDDDDLRRGRPTVHKAFDEATAILAGDALLTLAFDVLGRRSVHPSRRARRAGRHPGARRRHRRHGGRPDARPRGRRRHGAARSRPRSAACRR